MDVTRLFLPAKKYRFHYYVSIGGVFLEDGSSGYSADRRYGDPLCSSFVVHPASRNLIAKIRYFDGSMDTISITGYSPVGGSIRLKAEDGHIAVIGANNVIIVEDEEYWNE